MKRYKQFDKLVVHDFETSEWEHPIHNHNYFEIIFIVKGEGTHHLNNQMIPYQKGHLYLLGPEDQHEFMILKKTRFIYFKFTNFYLDTKDVDNPAQWNKDVDMILQSDERKNGNMLVYKSDQHLVEKLLALVVEEYENDKLLGKKVIFQFFKALVLILKRNLPYSTSNKKNPYATNQTEELLEYIDLNIYQPKMLTQRRIAEQFHLSSNYIGAFFKEKVGTSLKHYIQEYRFNLLKQRLLNGQMSAKQLALDFGFSDVSHLHKFVKSQSGSSFVTLKKKLREKISTA